MDLLLRNLLNQRLLLKEQVVVRYTLADFKKAQDMDIVIGTLKRLLKNPKGNLNNVPKTIRDGIQAYFRQAKSRLFVNGLRNLVFDGEDRRIGIQILQSLHDHHAPVVTSRSVVPNS